MKRTLSVLVLLVIGCVLAAQAQVFLAAGTEFVLVAGSSPPLPLLLPAEPISPAPQIDLNWQAASFSGCTSTNCYSDTRAGPQTCGSRKTFPPVTYAPTNTACSTDYGLAVFRASTNLIIQSSGGFAGSNWSCVNMTVADNVATAPDGTQTASSIVDHNKGTLLGYTCASSGPIAVTQNHIYTGSVYVKAGAGQQSNLVQIIFPFFQFTNVAVANFDTVSCVVVSRYINFSTTPVASGVTAGTEPQADGSCRIWLQQTATGTDAGSNPSGGRGGGIILNRIPYQYTEFVNGFGSTGVTYIGSESTSYIWGAQFEDGPLTPLMPTSGSIASRPADVIQPTGALLSLESGTQGTLIADVAQLATLSAQYVMSRNGTTDAFLQLAANGFGDNARVASANVAAAFTGSSPGANGGPSNLGSSWNSSGVSLVINGGTVVDSATPYGGTVNAYIGSANGSTGFLNGYIRRIVAYNTKQSNGTLQALAPIQGTPITGARNYYFANSGSDSNPCTIGSPCQTITKVNALTSVVPGSQILFDAGSSFTGCIVWNAPNMLFSDAANPITFGAYNGTPWNLTTNCHQYGITNGSAAITVGNVNGVTVQDCQFRPGSPSAEYGAYFFVANTITIQRCDIRGFNYLSQGNFGGMIFLNFVQNAQVLNNTLGGLSGATSPGEEGIAGQGSGINNFLISGNNIFDLGAASGGENGFFAVAVEMTGMNVGTTEFNLGHDIGANGTSCGGPVAFETFGVAGLTIQFNEGYNVQPSPSYISGCDWDTFDLDRGTSNTIAQYNYSHNSFGNGYQLFYGIGDNGEPWTNNYVAYSISENDGTEGGAGNMVFVFGENAIGNGAYNNTFYNNNAITAPGQADLLWAFNYIPPATGTGIVMNNVMVTHGNGNNQFLWNDCGCGSSFPAGWTFKANAYYAISPSTPSWHAGSNPNTLAGWQTVVASNGGDAGAQLLVSNPFTGTPGSGGTCSWTPSLNNGPQQCPSNYQAAGGSLLRSAGFDIVGGGFLASVGNRGYYNGTTVPGLGNCFNSGADSACP